MQRDIFGCIRKLKGFNIDECSLGTSQFKEPDVLDSQDAEIIAMVVAKRKAVPRREVVRRNSSTKSGWRV